MFTIIHRIYFSINVRVTLIIMTKLHIDEVCSKGSTYPLIVNFLHGNPTDKLQTEECLVLNDKKCLRKTLLTKIDNLAYAGDEEENNLSKTFIVKRNRKSGKVRIFESGTVNLKPVIHLERDVTLITDQFELSKKFGSKKYKKYMEQYQKLKVHTDTVTQQIQNATLEIPQETLDLSIYTQKNTDDFYIPIINRDATKAEEVYKISDMLAADHYEAISSELENKDYLSDLFPLTRNLVSKKTLSSRLNVLVVYADYLLKLNNTNVKEIAKKSYTICKHSNTLNNIILSNFTSNSNGKRIRPTTYKDKATCHVIVFLLLANNLKIELDSLCELLKLSPVTTSLKARVTGASVLNVGGKKIVQLKIPINTASTFKRKSAKF